MAPRGGGGGQGTQSAPDLALDLGFVDSVGPPRWLPGNVTGGGAFFNGRHTGAGGLGLPVPDEDSTGERSAGSSSGFTRGRPPGNFVGSERAVREEVGVSRGSGLARATGGGTRNSSVRGAVGSANGSIGLNALTAERTSFECGHSNSVSNLKLGKPPRSYLLLFLIPSLLIVIILLIVLPILFLSHLHPNDQRVTFNLVSEYGGGLCAALGEPVLVSTSNSSGNNEVSGNPLVSPLEVNPDRAVSQSASARVSTSAHANASTAATAHPTSTPLDVPIATRILMIPYSSGGQGCIQFRFGEDSSVWVESGSGAALDLAAPINFASADAPPLAPFNASDPDERYIIGTNQTVTFRNGSLALFVDAEEIEMGGDDAVLAFV
ncbi:hypothetical protein HK101_009804 [Irineochytrium annulatum]|nr:hypothetical protein HK101_009804 [Irineochytrium annulatum]